MLETIYEPFQIIRKYNDGIQLFIGLRSVNTKKYRIMCSHYIYKKDTQQFSKVLNNMALYTLEAMLEVDDPDNTTKWHTSKLKALQASWPTDATPLAKVLSEGKQDE